MKKFGLKNTLSNVWGGASRIAIIVALVMALGCLVACQTPNNGTESETGNGTSAGTETGNGTGTGTGTETGNETGTGTETSAKIVSTWKYEVITEGGSNIAILTFMDDNSWSSNATTTIKAEPENYIMTTNQSGTYTGDASKDEEIELTVKDVSVDMNDAMKKKYEQQGIDSNTLNAQYDALKGQKEQVTISGNELTLSQENSGGVTVTRTFTKQ